MHFRDKIRFLIISYDIPVPIKIVILIFNLIKSVTDRWHSENLEHAVDCYFTILIVFKKFRFDKYIYHQL